MLESDRRFGGGFIRVLHRLARFELRVHNFLYICSATDDGALEFTHERSVSHKELFNSHLYITLQISS
jgi:hypothetical protein